MVCTFIALFYLIGTSQCVTRSGVYGQEEPEIEPTTKLLNHSCPMCMCFLLDPKEGHVFNRVTVDLFQESQFEIPESSRSQVLWKVSDTAITS